MHRAIRMQEFRAGWENTCRGSCRRSCIGRSECRNLEHVYLNRVLNLCAAILLCRSSSIFERTPFAAIVSMGLNKLMRRRVSGSVATRVTMRATLVQLREDEDETTSVRAITLHCELREEPIGLLDTIPIDCQRPLLTGDQYGAACDPLNDRMLLNCS